MNGELHDGDYSEFNVRRLICLYVILIHVHGREVMKEERVIFKKYAHEDLRTSPIDV